MHCKHQLTRDGIHCRAFERTEQETVLTIDKYHNVDQGEEGQHICHDFTNPGVLGCMDRQWSGQVFRHVIMDYFYTPGSWHEELHQRPSSTVVYYAQDFQSNGESTV